MTSLAILLDTLDREGLTRYDLAIKLRMPLKQLNNIITSPPHLWPYTFLKKLETLLDLPLSFWALLEDQNDYL